VALGWADGSTTSALRQLTDLPLITEEADRLAKLEIVRSQLNRSLAIHDPMPLEQECTGDDESEITLAMLGMSTDRLTVIDIDNAPEFLQYLDVWGNGKQIVVIPHGLEITLEGTTAQCAYADFRAEVIG